MKKHITRLLQIIPVLFICLSTTNAQQHFVAYNLPYLPQRMYANPALIPVSRVNIALPVISSVYLNVSNTGFKINDVTGMHGDSAFIDMNNFLSKLKKNNYITLNTDIDLISFGFRVKNNYFSFNATEKIDVNFRYPKAFFEFIWQGNGAFLGEEKKFNFGINSSHYREYGFGYARNIDDKLTVGGKLKYLYGMENAYTKKSDITLLTDANDFSIKASSDIILHTSGIVSDTNSNGTSFSEYFFGRKNTGFGIDLGAVYKLNNKITLSGSVIDIGSIKWKSNVTSYVSKNPGASYEFKGLEFEVFKSDTVALGDLMSTAMDSLGKTFEIEEKTGGSYTTFLPAKIYLSGNYLFDEKHWAGVLLFGQFFNKSLHSGLTLSYTTHVGKALSSTLTYSIYNRSFSNIGFGFTVNAGPVQLYLISDNVLGMLQFNRYNSGGGSFILPAYTKTMNLHFGLQMTFGRKDRDKDKDGTPDKTDLCPDVSGVKALGGCPDKDGDLVIDKNDECPEKPGVPALKGCPDYDNDGIKDSDDACPDEAGPAYTKGCPDTDNDSIPNKQDKCPDKVGTRENEGCPLVKLMMYDKEGNLIGEALVDKEGRFIFSSLPPDENVFFKMEGEDLDPDKILLTMGGKNKLLKKNENGTLGLEQPKLVMYDKNGNIIGVAVRDKDGNFVFTSLPPDENVFFKMEGDDIPLNSLKIRLADQNRKVVNKDGNLILEPIDNTPATPESVVEVTLDTKEKEVVKTAFNNLEFEAAKDVIKKESFPSLFELAALMKKNPDWILRISGHSDKTGNEKNNIALSLKRAEAVKKFLLLSGIPESRYIVESFGSAKPIADNKTPEGRQKNRRVEMMIVEKK